MYQNHKKTKSMQEALIKLHVPQSLKQELQELADERNISLSALMRLLASEYIKRTKSI